jgi:uncharacterized protein (TIGR03435 family)
VKPSKEPWPPNFPLDGGNAKTAVGRLHAGLPLGVFISFAYKLSPSESQALTAQLPRSVSANFYDIDARADENPTKDQMRLMMQSLLADRFKLKVHFETGEASGVCADFGEAGQGGAGAASTLRRTALPRILYRPGAGRRSP